MKKILLLILTVTTVNGFAQEHDTLKVMSYNLLRFPSISPERIDTLKEILAYVKPDILMVCELTSGDGAEDILFNALNEDGESAYDMADYVAGPDTENELYFNSDKLGLLEQNEISTVLRDINEYVLFYKSTDLETTTDTTFFYVYVCHLKASPGFEEQRNIEATALKTYINGRDNAENIIIGGDFNFYGSDTEPAWNTLLTGGGVVIKDPLILPGHWHADPGFSWVHTQSTRTTEFGGGAYGGMDDRFDFIFVGADLKDYSNDAIYINGSYRAIGQDGLHYDKSLIEAPENTSEPANVIAALYYMSDHLPVYLEIEVIKEGASIDEDDSGIFDIFYDAKSEVLNISLKDGFNLNETVEFEIYNVSGQLVETFESSDTSTTISTNGFESGTYILRLSNSTYTFKFVKS